MAAENHSVQLACLVLGVSESGYYAQRSRAPSPRAIRHAWLTDVILQVHAASRQTYGMRRIRAELTDAYGQVVNKKLVRSIMRAQGLTGLPVRRRRKPNLAHNFTAEDLVNRDFRRDGPN